MSTVKTGWGVKSDTDEALVSKSGGKFGLNTGNIVKFEYNGLAGKDNGPADAIDITFMSLDKKEYRLRIYDITGSLYGPNNTQIASGESGYDALYEKEKTQREAVITHVVKALGGDEQSMNNAIAKGNVVDFKTWAEAITNSKPANFADFPVDAFVEYQYSIKDENKMTFLQLPQNMKGGRFLSQHIAPVGTWKSEPTADGGMRYIDDAQNEHPFVKSANFMQSPKANQIFLDANGEESSSNHMAPTAPGAPAGAPVAKKW